MKADLLTRLRLWSEKPNEGDAIIDAMAGDLQEALEFIEAVERSKPLFYGVFDASGGLVGLFDNEGRANESLMGERTLRPFYATPVIPGEPVAWQRITRRWHPDRVGLIEITDDPETAALWQVDPMTADVRELFATEDSRGLFAGRPE